MIHPFSYLGQQPTGSGFTLTLTYTAGNNPGYSLAQWNTLLNGNYTDKQELGDTIILTGGSSVNIPDAAFNGAVHLDVVADDGSIKTIGQGGFQNSGIRSATLNGCNALGPFAFADCILFEYGEFQVLTDLGGTTAGDGVFENMNGQTISLTIPAALMTNNGGSPDGDIEDLQVLNTVNITTV